MNTQKNIVPKNATAGYTESWKRERDRQMKFYQTTPFYGSEHAEKLYKIMKAAIPSLIQASVCGMCVTLTVYKKDEDNAAYLLATAFKKIVNRKDCPYTEYVTISLLNK